MVIQDDEVEKALDFLRNSSQEAAEARAQAKYLSEYLKSKVAQIATKQDGMSAAAAEHFAKAHPDYIALLEGYKVAVERDAFFTFKREAADALIRAWQTMCATARAEGRAYG